VCIFGHIHIPYPLFEAVAVRYDGVRYGYMTDESGIHDTVDRGSATVDRGSAS